MAALANISVLDVLPATIGLPPAFAIQAQDYRLSQTPVNSTTSTTAPVVPAPSLPPLGVLSNFVGTFGGTGLNLIFRPNSAEQLLEINLTEETLTFSTSLGSIPNRGLFSQPDIFLNGVPYVQAISDVTNPNTGKADGAPSGIHFEPGLWMHVPGTTVDPNLGESLARMASIPHGTTINAQCLAPTSSSSGAPNIPAVDITPFFIGQPNSKNTFASQTASNSNTARLPKDLSKFITAGTITQAILNDPNTVLRNDNHGKTITSSTTFTVSTAPTSPEFGGGTDNIAFLLGNPQVTSPNANAAFMNATFWINTVQNKLLVPVWKVGSPPLILQPPVPRAGAKVETYLVTPPHAITVPTNITVTATQIQYSQTVFLNFNGLTWPHVSVATLVQLGNLTVPSSAWN